MYEKPFLFFFFLPFVTDIRKAFSEIFKWASQSLKHMTLKDQEQVLEFPAIINDCVSWMFVRVTITFQGKRDWIPQNKELIKVVLDSSEVYTMLTGNDMMGYRQPKNVPGCLSVPLRLSFSISDQRSSRPSRASLFQQAGSHSPQGQDYSNWN